MTSFPGQPDHPQARPTPRCAWHPERAAYVTCQRCGRAVCPECQRPAAVGVQCPECSVQGSAFTEAQRTAARNAQRRNTPWVIYSIMVLCVLAYLAQLAIPGFTDRLFQRNDVIWAQPWRLLTAAFLHDTGSALPMHLGLNMLSLWFLGRVAEPFYGHWRIGAIFLVGALGGGLAQILLDEPLASVLGASGGVFAVGGAVMVAMRKDKGQLVSLGTVLALNLVYGMVQTGIAWQAHLGGLVTGALLAFVYSALGTVPATIRGKRSATQAAITLVVAVAIWAGAMAASRHAFETYVRQYLGG